jgi:hypothetical protein
VVSVRAGNGALANAAFNVVEIAPVMSVKRETASAGSAREATVSEVSVNEAIESVENAKVETASAASENAETVLVANERQAIASAVSVKVVIEWAENVA